jgi:hypothetical protein
MKNRFEVPLELFVFGYLGCYIPYSTLSKGLSSGVLGTGQTPSGVQMLPVTTITLCCGTLLFFTVTGWWKYPEKKRVFGLSIPVPTRWTLVSGIAAAVIINTTALSYTFPGVSIPFIQLMMRGDVLLMAPLVDRLTGRKVRWYSWVALALVACALIIVIQQRGGLMMPSLAILTIALYVLGYFLRIWSMSHAAKSSDASARKRFYVEEQMIATPLAVLMLVGLALIGKSGPLLGLRWGFLDVWSSPILPWLIIIGTLVVGISIFAARILLDERENTFCVPLERASSVLAGIAATFILSWWFGMPAPKSHELFGASLLVVAILVLSLGPRLGPKGRGLVVGPDVSPKPSR